MSIRMSEDGLATSKIDTSCLPKQIQFHFAFNLR